MKGQLISNTPFQKLCRFHKLYPKSRFYSIYEVVSCSAQGPILIREITDKARGIHKINWIERDSNPECSAKHSLEES